MTKTYEEIVALVRDTLVDAGSTFREDKKEAYRRAIGTERNEQANVFTVEIALETEKTIYGLGYGYYLNEKLVSSGGVINADETPLKDRVTLEVDRRDLPKDTDLSGFRLSLSVYLSPGDDAKETEAPLGSEWVLSDVAWGGVYQLTLCDNEDNGFEVWD